jgi:hypothetical protein
VKTDVNSAISHLEVVKKTFHLKTFFSSKKHFVSTKETFVSSTTYAAIPYSGTFLWKTVQNSQEP